MIKHISFLIDKEKKIVIKGKNGTGKVFVHGLGQTPESWNAVLSSMDETEKCVCPNLVEGVKNQNVNYKNLYKAFSELCDEFDESINLCGLSLGGVLALNYAIERPEKVKSLVLIATPYKMPKMLLKLHRSASSALQSRRLKCLTLKFLKDIPKLSILII